MRLPACLLALALLAGCDAAAPGAPAADPFGPPGTWATVATLDAGAAVSLTLDPAGPALLVAGGRAGALRVDVSRPDGATRALGFAVAAEAGPYAGPGYGVSRVVRVGADLLLGTTHAPDGAGLFRSADGGATWARSDAGVDGRSAATDLAVSGDVVLAQAGGLVRSADGGRTWAAVGPGRGDADEAETVAFRPGVAGEAWATVRSRTGVEALASVDGGRTWAAPALALPAATFAVGGFGWDGGGALWLGANAGVVQNRTAVEGGRVVGTAGRLVGRPDDGWCAATAPHPARADVALAACGGRLLLADGDRTFALDGPTGEPITALVYDAAADALYVGAGRTVRRLSAPFEAPRAEL